MVRGHDRFEGSLRPHPQFHGQYGESWEPAPLLRRLAEERRTFADFDADRKVI